MQEGTTKSVFNSNILLFDILGNKETGGSRGNSGNNGNNENSGYSENGKENAQIGLQEGTIIIHMIQI